eukprot:909119-Amphidinium_carterae.1
MSKMRLHMKQQPPPRDYQSSVSASRGMNQHTMPFVIQQSLLHEAAVSLIRHKQGRDREGERNPFPVTRNGHRGAASQRLRAEKGGVVFQVVRRLLGVVKDRVLRCSYLGSSRKGLEFQCLGFFAANPEGPTGRVFSFKS